MTDIRERVRNLQEVAESGPEREFYDAVGAELDRLRAALEPFAKMAAHYAAYQGEDFETKDTVHGFTIGQFRRAREALGTK